MRNKYTRYIAVQTVIMLIIFMTIVFVLLRSQQSENNYLLSSIGQSVSYSVQQHIAITEGVLTSLAYNYEIDDKIDKYKFDILAAKYMEENQDILYIQHKDKDTVTDMVYPGAYDYTLGASLRGRPEVEEALDKAIKNRAITINDPFILKNTRDLMGLVIRYPLYKDDQFNGFFVVVFNFNTYMDKVIREAVPDSYHISIYNEKGGLIWGDSPWMDRDSYIVQIPVMDTYWTMKLSKEGNSINANGAVIGFISVLILILMGVLIYVQMGLFKKDENIQHLASLHKELERLKESYTLALDSANDALWEWNLMTDEIITSDKWIDITGNAPKGHGLRGILQEETIHQEDYQAVLAAFDSCLMGETREFHREYRIKNKDGSYTWVLNKGKVYFDGDGLPGKIAGAVSNIDDRKQKESKMEYMAFYDTLTGLPNKVRFMSTLEDTLRNIGETLCRYSILMIDLDNFKIHNDLLGLDFCDQLLKQVGDRLSQILGQENMVARFGGDEFLILIRDHEDIGEVERICQNILSIFGAPFVLMDKSVYLSVSIGVVHGLEAGQTANNVLRNADTALNKAKESGKNQYCIYDAQMHDEIIRKSNVEVCIREALANDDLLIYYQLQQDLLRDEIRGVEALARLYSKELGMILPLEFIEVAEYTGLIIPLGSWILKNACKQGKAWIDSGYKFGKLSVNISVHQLRNENFYDQVKRVLDETRFPVNQLELEITESVLLEFSQNNIEILKKLRSLGVSIALDDFGTGYSSLNYLTVLPIDILKIDKSFLGRALESETEQQVIKSITELAHGLNLKVVCEGVETIEQRQILKEMGCDYIQGYYFAKPGDAKSIEKWFREGSEAT
ncbi:bifunctional diguanylate cyclase/phosphodiesterase [Lacrimispora sp.]|jgi:diguanylate cyclase (GGDEF)-like protein/PAS domain S-box-containing protein|uniref:bifunctional diguanylate cyclase/phosphodiesterase n=2 Tax=Lacrimispora sp. TaxID=2719234 RepID=UPI002896BC44|nr:EAL domain-containing protein [Lacrimispora sp.]